MLCTVLRSGRGICLRDLRTSLRRRWAPSSRWGLRWTRKAPQGVSVDECGLICFALGLAVVALEVRCGLGVSLGHRAWVVVYWLVGTWDLGGRGEPRQKGYLVFACDGTLYRRTKE